MSCKKLASREWMLALMVVDPSCYCVICPPAFPQPKNGIENFAAKRKKRKSRKKFPVLLFPSKLLPEKLKRSPSETFSFIRKAAPKAA